MNNVVHPTDYDRTDASPRLVGALAVGVAAFLAVTPFVLEAIFPGSQRMGGVPRDLPVPPAPRLQVHPKDDLDRLHAAEDVQLSTYGWVDRERKIVRIPIERAMQLTVERGLPGWRSSPASASTSPAGR